LVAYLVGVLVAHNARTGEYAQFQTFFSPKNVFDLKKRFSTNLHTWLLLSLAKTSGYRISSDRINSIGKLTQFSTHFVRNAHFAPNEYNRTPATLRSRYGCQTKSPRQKIQEKFTKIFSKSPWQRPTKVLHFIPKVSELFAREHNIPSHTVNWGLPSLRHFLFSERTRKDIRAGSSNRQSLPAKKFCFSVINCLTSKPACDILQLYSKRFHSQRIQSPKATLPRGLFLCSSVPLSKTNSQDQA